MKKVRDSGRRVPLSALMSQALVAFTIEFDNEFEHQMPHRTTNHGPSLTLGHGPWLVSMAMWVHCMRYVAGEGISAGELVRRAQLPAQIAQMILTRMSKWWGYLVVRPDPADTRTKPPASAWTVHPTPAGRQAQHVWSPLRQLIEDRWRARFGAGRIDPLAARLATVVSQLDARLPDYLPIGEQFQAWPVDPAAARTGLADGNRSGSELSLPALLSKLLVSFTLDFESQPAVPLAFSANLVRVLDDQGVPVRDLPALTGVAAIGVQNSLSILEKRRYIAVGTTPTAGRTKLARLTAKGCEAQDTYHDRVVEVERDWQARFGERAVHAIRESLEALTGAGTAKESPLFGGLEPYPDGWRSELPKPDTLPHYPMVSHRGGFPDGS